MEKTTRSPFFVIVFSKYKNNEASIHRGEGGADNHKGMMFCICTDVDAYELQSC